MIQKILASADEAVGDVSDGATLVVGGFGLRDPGESDAPSSGAASEPDGRLEQLRRDDGGSGCSCARARSEDGLLLRRRERRVRAPVPVGRLEVELVPRHARRADAALAPIGVLHAGRWARFIAEARGSDLRRARVRLERGIVRGFHGRRVVDRLATWSIGRRRATSIHGGDCGPDLDRGGRGVVEVELDPGHPHARRLVQRVVVAPRQKRIERRTVRKT